MPKRPLGPSFDPATRDRLRAVGEFELVTDPGDCELHFDELFPAAAGLPAFAVSWFVGGPGRGLPAPADGLFALWEKYRAAHAGLCPEYRRLLFAAFERSPLAGYDDRKWRLVRRVRPTAHDLTGTVGTALLRFDQQQARGDQAPAFSASVEFTTFWNEHGLAARLHETADGFAVGEWAGIGDL